MGAGHNEKRRFQSYVQRAHTQEVTLMFSSVSSALLWRGLLAIAIGIVSVV
jgi:sulfur transfer protein SufE